MPSPGNLTSQGNGGGRSPTHRVAVLGQVAGQVAEVSMSMSPKWGRCGLGRGLQLGADPKTWEQRGQGRGVREGPVGSLSTLTWGPGPDSRARAAQPRLVKPPQLWTLLLGGPRRGQSPPPAGH